MKKTQKQIAIDRINEKIDSLIIEGKTATKQYKKLMRIHKVLVRG